MSGRLALGVFMGLGLSGCLFQGDCPGSVRGIHHHDQVQTRIVGPLANPPPGASTSSATQSCGDLGDLSIGTVLVSQASLVGGAESCEDGVMLTPQQITTGTLSTGTGLVSIHLANGCTGFFQVDLVSPNSSSSYLDNSKVSSGAPAWWLRREFTPTGDASLCFRGDDPPSRCSDAFLATNSLVP